MSESEVIEGINKILSKLSKEDNQKRFKNWDKKVGFSFADFNKTWTTQLSKGKAGELQEGPIDKSANYDILIITDPETWLGVVNKEIKAMEAFTSGKLKIKGSVTDLLKLKRVM
ncbi:MAG: hypothetical protein EAX86_05240 [Candidatus Heimdallarchaeota archaeon]|nr:hypothetical protein [Candidatus Heimdallarchaeota archaeon]